MVDLDELVAFLDQTTRRTEFKDFPGAENGLQVGRKGPIRKIAAAVDAGTEPFRQAIAEGVDLLIVHHGLYWNPPQPMTGSDYEKIRVLIEGNLAVYSSHLPLDAHPQIGNNALIAKALELEPVGTFLHHEGKDIALIAKAPPSREVLAERLRTLFPDTFKAIEYGSSQPENIAILSGSGSSAVAHLRAAGVDTLISGELRQQYFNMAQEQKLNLYPCGHYATEVFGVKELARIAAERFKLDHSFVQTGCLL